jgi:hypothetical protein
MDLRIANQELWAARGQSIRIGDQMVIPPHGSPPPPPEIRLVPVEPGESAGDEEAGEEEAVEEEAAAEEGILTPAEPEEIIVDEEAAEDQVVDDEAVGEEVVEEEGVDGVEPTPVAPQEAVTPTPLPTDESEEEPTGPMQPETPEASRLRIDLDAPTIIYVVQGGEDWASVAAKIGVTAEALQSANPTLGGRALQEGDQLRLP